MRRQAARVLLAGGLAAALVGACNDDDDDDAGATTTAPVEDTTTTTTAPVEETTATTEGGVEGDPVAAAEAFLARFFPGTRTTLGAFQQGDSQSGEVQVFRPDVDLSGVEAGKELVIIGAGGTGLDGDTGEFSIIRVTVS
jgi:hypothetical protein